jgi:hypothetical protein
VVELITHLTVSRLAFRFSPLTFHIKKFEGPIKEQIATRPRLNAQKHYASPASGPVKMACCEAAAPTSSGRVHPKASANVVR